LVFCCKFTSNLGHTLPVCYYLYSLQGALLGLHWDDLPTELKTELRKQVDKKRSTYA